MLELEVSSLPFPAKTVLKVVRLERRQYLISNREQQQMTFDDNTFKMAAHPGTQVRYDLNAKPLLDADL